GVWLHSVAAVCRRGVSHCSWCAIYYTLNNPKRIDEYTATQKDKRTRADYPFTGWRGDDHGGPACPAQPQPGNARSALNENAGINSIRHLVHVFDVARVHCRLVVATASQFHR